MRLRDDFIQSKEAHTTKISRRDMSVDVPSARSSRSRRGCGEKIRSEVCSSACYNLACLHVGANECGFLVITAPNKIWTPVELAEAGFT